MSPKNFCRSYILLSSLIFSLLTNAEIIGTDDRKEATQLQGALRQRVESVSTMVMRTANNLTTEGGYRFDPNYRNKVSIGFCADQRFADQPTPDEVICGGLLIAPDLVLTARHCLDDSESCSENYSFLFGYTDQRNSFFKDDTYHCKNVLWKKTVGGTDAAVIQLDRPVVGRTPVRLPETSNLREGSVVNLIGPQRKLSLKTSRGAVRYISRSASPETAYGTSLDCDQNDSGSPVFNHKGEFEGVFFASGTLNRPPFNTPTPGPLKRRKSVASPSSTAVGTSEKPTPPPAEPCYRTPVEEDHADRRTYEPRADHTPVHINDDALASAPPKGCVFTPVHYFRSEIEPLISASWERSRQSEGNDSASSESAPTTR